MKILNLIKLEVELNLRRIAYFIVIISVIGWFLVIIGLNNKINGVASNDKWIFDYFGIFSSFFSIPILTSIFILVATRKFKEIKQLIKEIE